MRKLFATYIPDLDHPDVGWKVIILTIQVTDWERLATVVFIDKDGTLRQDTISQFRVL